ncbi:MAG: Putative transmembrane protein [uncultured Pyrinomonadaceae bacterium]|uniref:Transmembrane protein n=1 Tax=uncultured Pyrinomonadaceae bacterium TaxID=2283094 RepID=A0A6J4NX45_9BACT|nr:MAG: Putative transmembrane protein [uncultured Pyrinomonadaceae bacterium]
MELATKQNYWLFSREIDLSVFLGSAVVSLILLAVGWQLGILNDESPDWTWISAVLLIDVAHVWSTSFRVYFDAEEFKRRIWLYTLVPVFGYATGVALYSESALTFWRVLALLAVFHFVRQQYGWVNLYRAKLKEKSNLTWWIDALAIYLATIYPLAFWMTSLPRNFQWFVENDFFNLPRVVEQILFPVYVLALIAYFGKSIYLYFTTGFLNVGKDIIVLTTAVCWYVGIVALDSDYAFTVTNVIIHGVPYFALVYFYARQRRETAGRFYKSVSSHWIVFLATLWALAYTEEIFWHRGVWHERDYLFGANWNTSDWKTYLVPLLAVPQLTHYVLDGFVWKRKNNENFRLIG